MKISYTCPRCNGTGAAENNIYGLKKCYDCRGRGYREFKFAEIDQVWGLVSKDGTLLKTRSGKCGWSRAGFAKSALTGMVGKKWAHHALENGDIVVKRLGVIDAEGDAAE